MKRIPLREVHVQIAASFAGEVKAASLSRAARAAFESAGEQYGGELTLVITDDAQMRELNRAYRGVDATTDVLAFGNRQEADTFVPSPQAPAYFGDIVISYPRATEQARAHAHPLEEELLLLVIHGVLHLLGYDHAEESDREKMWRRQSTALTSLGIHWQP